MRSKITNNRETIIWTPEEQVRVSNLEERFQIPVSPDDLRNYWDALLNMNEVDRIRQWLSTVSEIARLKLDLLEWTVTSRIDTSEVEQEAIDRLSIRENSENEAASALEIASRNMDELWNNEAASALEIASRNMDELWNNEAASALEIASRNAVFWGKMEKLPIIWWLFKLIRKFVSWVKWFFSVWDKIWEVAWSVSEISHEDLIEGIISKSHLQEREIRPILESSWIKTDQLSEIYNRLRSWEKVTLDDIRNIIKPPQEINDILSSPEEALEEARDRITSVIVKWIREQYWIELTWKKLDKLKEIVKKYFGLSGQNIENLQYMAGERQWELKGLYPLLPDMSLRSTKFAFALISEWIIPISAIWLDVAKTGLNTIKLSLSWLWITNESISFEDLIGWVRESENPELFLWVLYRKWGLFFSILWSISESVTQAGIEFLTKSTVTSGSLTWNSLIRNFNKQAKNFDTLHEAMTKVRGTTRPSEIIGEAIENLKKVKQNYEIIDILNKKPFKIDVAKKSILEIFESGSELLKNKINNASNLGNLRNIVSGQFSLPQPNSWAIWNLLSELGFWKQADVFNLNRQLEYIVENQRVIVKNQYMTKPLKSIREVFRIWKISRLADKVIYHFDNIDQALQFSTIAKQFPRLLWATIDKLPIITVAWLALTKDEGKIEDLHKWLLSLIPFIWPALLIGELGIGVNEENQIEVKKPIEATIWWVLLTLDWVFAVKAWITWGWRWVWSYLTKPIKDIYSIGRWTLEIADTARVAWTRAIKSIRKPRGFPAFIRSLANKPNKWLLKNILRTKPWAIAIAAVTLGLFVWHQVWNAKENEEVYDTLISEWLINENWEYWEELLEAIRNWDIDDEEKQVLTELIVSKNSPVNLEKIELSIEWDNLKIVSRNPKIQSDYFMTAEWVGELEELLWINYSSANFSFEEPEEAV